MRPKTGIGAHVSTKGGFLQAAKRAYEMGATAFQYFPKNPRSLSLKSLDRKDATLCRDWCEEHGMASIAHSPYPTNPALGMTRGEAGFHAIVSSIRNDLEISNACGSVGTVVHFGHIQTKDPLEGYRNLIHCLDTALEGWQGESKILLENQAGDHGPMGTTMEEMIQIRKLSRFPEHIAFCFDTCHAFASGMWKAGDENILLEKGRQLEYWDDLAAVHFNDSKYASGLNKDRHARIGHGHMGYESMKKLLQSPHIKQAVVVMETETGEDGTHSEDIQLMRSWL
ncbi:deoxyribonuclease IV [Paenibacillus polysaccharolyticus]|uniref:deoxyribonuclease IV n=1 Tax=Paenibacillus polysaccharolyticus TaxID=582692 RepID=UPI0012B9F7DB|nr:MULTISPECIES: deoxyribonuclease IV [Paenibacillus]MCP1133430.1 deoxyribonuclease IV [Paenibacillus polysaccharolyticus]